MARDPYAYHVAFDDILGGAGEPVDLIDMAGATLRTLAKRRLRSVPLVVEHARVDTTEWSFEPVTHVVGDAGVPAGDYPLFDLLRARFRSAIGKPKLARLDDEETYEYFRSRRRQPHIDELDARLANLEQAVAEHTADHHGGGRLARLEAVVFDHIANGHDEVEVLDAPNYMRSLIGAVTDAARGGKRVPLGLPASARGKIECWLDGDEVLISARLPCGIVTTGAPLHPEFEDVVGCAEIVGCCGLEALLIGCEIAPRTLGRRLLGDLARVAPTIIDASEPHALVIRPLSDPSLAAAMALLQRCQRGDRKACREAVSMAHGSGSALVGEAAECLTRAQEDKARRS